MAFGIYIFVVGLSFIFIPNLVLPLFGFATTTEVWIRVLGLLTTILGTYYLYCAYHNLRLFFRATVFGRMAFCVGLITLAVLGLGGPMLIILGLIDLMGAVWTGLSLRVSESSAA
jgi:hypothetical protein